MRIAFDIKLMRPGCAIIQAAYGCDGRIAHEFPTDTWLLTPTPDIKIYPVTAEQIAKLVQMVCEKRGVDHV